METLDQWIARQYRHSAAKMLNSISAQITKHRTGFGQTVVPKKGSIVASPVLADYDPDPDYFFHWYRDSAVVIDALRLLHGDGSVGPVALEHFAEFVHFSLSLQNLDGRALVARPEWRGRIEPGCERFVRTEAELAAVRGASVATEARVNPDGSLDIIKWARPQHDGPPMRAIAVLRWLRGGRFDPRLEAAVATLLRADLSFARQRWRESCFDIWEQEMGFHYYTLRVCGGALEAGAHWLDECGNSSESQACRIELQYIRDRLDEYWLPTEGYYRSKFVNDAAASSKNLDISVILAAIHTFGTGQWHDVHDARMQRTLTCLESLFDAEYPINQKRAAARAPALGRYAGDVYFSGGAYYFSTLAAAELCFRAAVGSGEAADFVLRGDAYLETVRAFTPLSGDLSEQFDQKTGVQTSARQLAWSYAAFVSCIAARRVAIGAMG